MARQPPEDPEKEQIVGKNRDGEADQPPGGLQPFNVVEIQRGDNQLLGGTRDRSDGQRNNQRHQQTDQRDKIAEVFYPDFLFVLRPALPDVARLGADRFAQIAHPVNTGIEGDQQADQTDGGALLHRGVDGVFQRRRQRRVADVLQNLVENVLQQGRVPGQHETGGGKGDHQDWDHRQEREVGDGRAELIAQPVIETFCGAQ